MNQVPNNKNKVSESQRYRNMLTTTGIDSNNNNIDQNYLSKDTT